ncbi:MAG: hypothetical protein KDB79_00530 [Acidobacteria bacterium]|nr:hypothetical protein [Acidobacteriota bacterium]
MNKKNVLIQVLFLGGAILLISALHFLTPINNLVFHQIYQRLYYIPIILAAFGYGWRGGLGAALFASLTYLPHIVIYWQTQNYEYAINQYAEVGMFFIIGSVTGWLGDQKSREHDRAEEINAELQTAYADLRKTFDQLLQAEKLSSLAEIASGVVHEVRNPLGAIKGAVEILEDELAEDSPRREFANIAKTEVERINKLVSEFLHFARSPEPQKEPTDVNALIGAVHLLIEQKAQQQNISVVEELMKELPLLPLDAEQIKQVLLNLALNAIQAMPTGGKLTFTTISDEKHVLVEVSDTGTGIDEQKLRQVFDPLYSTKDKSLGLGLSIAYKIINDHQGHISAKNSANGAVFRLEFLR